MQPRDCLESLILTRSAARESSPVLEIGVGDARQVLGLRIRSCALEKKCQVLGIGPTWETGPASLQEIHAEDEAPDPHAATQRILPKVRSIRGLALFEDFSVTFYSVPQCRDIYPLVTCKVSSRDESTEIRPVIHVQKAHVVSSDSLQARLSRMPRPTGRRGSMDSGIES
jgi:hypothetical protein